MGIDFYRFSLSVILRGMVRLLRRRLVPRLSVSDGVEDIQLVWMVSQLAVRGGGEREKEISMGQFTWNVCANCISRVFSARPFLFIICAIVQ